MPTLDSAFSTFTTLELERLVAYRAAVAAGFYTDWDGGAEETDTSVLAWLPGPGGSAAPDPDAYLFTAEERQRLEATRAAVAAGRYSDDPPPRANQDATPEQQTR